MARSGRFGHLPSGAPDLSSTIVAMMEQYENQRDRNIQTAWEQGGLFEGKKVTDQMFLDWWKRRASQVSRDDPMYDYYQQSLFSYRFQIAESKANLQYQRGDWSEWDMARFYRQQSHNVPQASQAWRDLMTNAARFAKAARAKRNASNAQAAADAFAARWKQADRRYIQPARVVEEALNYLGRRNGWLGEGESWQSLNMGEGEVLSFNSMLAQVEASPGWNRTRKYLEQHDPNFHGHLTIDYVSRSFDRAKHGTRIQQQAAEKIGYSSYVEAAKKDRANWDDKGTQAEVWDLDVAYAQARQTFLDAGGNDATKTPAERAAARATYYNALTKLERRFEKRGDETSAGKLLNERRMLTGQEGVGDDLLLYEDWSGTSTGHSTVAKDVSEAVRDENEQLAALGRGELVQIIDAEGRPTLVTPQEAQSQYGVNGSTVLVRSTLPSRVTDPDGKVIEIPATTYAEVRERIPLTVMIPDPRTFDTYSQTYTDSGSLPTQPGQSTQVGYVIFDAQGNKTYQLFTGDGTSIFTNDSPFRGGSVLRQDRIGDQWVVLADPRWTQERAHGAITPVQTNADRPEEEPEYAPQANPRAMLEEKFSPGARTGLEPSEAPEEVPEDPEIERIRNLTPEERRRDISDLQGKFSALQSGNPELRLSDADQAELYSLVNKTFTTADPAGNWTQQQIDARIAELRAKAGAMDPGEMAREYSRRITQLTSTLPRREQMTQADADRLAEITRRRDFYRDRPKAHGLERTQDEQIVEEYNRQIGEITQKQLPGGAITPQMEQQLVGPRAGTVFGAIEARLRVMSGFGVHGRGENLTPEEQAMRAVNERDGWSTYTTFYYSQDQQKRKEFNQMDPLAVLRTLQLQDPEVIRDPATLNRAVNEVESIRTGASQSEGEFLRNMLVNSAIPFVGGLTMDTMTAIAGRVGVSSAAATRAGLRQDGVPTVGEPDDASEGGIPGLEHPEWGGRRTNPEPPAVGPIPPAIPGRAGATTPDIKIPDIPGLPPFLSSSAAALEAAARVRGRPQGPPVTPPPPPPRPALVRPIQTRVRPQPKIKVPDPPVIPPPPPPPPLPPARTPRPPGPPPERPPTRRPGVPY